MLRAGSKSVVLPPRGSMPEAKSIKEHIQIAALTVLRPHRLSPRRQPYQTDEEGQWRGPSQGPPPLSRPEPYIDVVGGRRDLCHLP